MMLRSMTMIRKIRYVLIAVLSAIGFMSLFMSTVKFLLGE
jgi:hypothetical protein